MNIIRSIFCKELPNINEKYRLFSNIFAVIVILMLGFTFVLSMHYYNVLVLAGEAGDLTTKHLQDILNKFSGNPLLYWGLIGYLTSMTAYRSWISWIGFSKYEKLISKKIDLQEMFAIQLVNAINTLFTPMLFFIAAQVAFSYGLESSDGGVFNLFKEMILWANNQVIRVPTLFSLPKWPAFFASFMLLTCLHYWLHRLAHTRRILWLLLHRPHHIPTQLTQLTIAPVVSNFPFWFIILVPYIFIFGAASKIFYETPQYNEFFLFWMFSLFIETWAHGAALYKQGIKKPWVVIMSNFSAGGLYHVLHHSSSNEAIRVGNNNTVNIGPGIFFIWDRLFGTYQPLISETPAVGLHGQPRLFLNPLRMACAGFLQLGYELYHNRSLKVYWRILTGPSSYSPAVTRDYMVHETNSATNSDAVSG